MTLAIAVAVLYTLAVAGLAIHKGFVQKTYRPRRGNIFGAFPAIVLLLGASNLFWRESRKPPEEMSWFARAYYDRAVVGGVYGVRAMAIVFGCIALFSACLAAAEIAAPFRERAATKSARRGRA